MKKKSTVLVGNTLYDTASIPSEQEKSTLIDAKVIQNKATVQREKDKRELRRACDTVKFSFTKANEMESKPEILRVNGKPDYYNKAWRGIRERAVQYINSAMDSDLMKVLVEQFNENKRAVSMYSKEDLETMTESLKARKKGSRFKLDATDKVFKVRVAEVKTMTETKAVINGWFLEHGVDIRNSTIIEEILFSVCGMRTNTAKKDRANSGYVNLLKNNSTRALNNMYCTLVELMTIAKAIKPAVIDKDVLEVINNKDAVMINNSMGRILSGGYGKRVEVVEKES